METLRERSTAPTRFELVPRDPESLMLTATQRGYNNIHPGRNKKLSYKDYLRLNLF